MSIFIKHTKDKGRGVFTDGLINKGGIIESSPVIVFEKDDWQYISKTDINCYCFYWDKTLNDGAIALGYGSLFNHSYDPNAYFIRRIKDNTIDFIALRDINANEEITINYNGSENKNAPLWFDVL